MSTSLPAPAHPVAAPSRPVVLVSVPNGDPKRAELWDDNASTTTVQVVYCDSRRSAHVARNRILGPAPTEQPAPAAEPADQALTAAVARPTRRSLREAGDPQSGIYFGNDRRRPQERGRRVRLERGSNFVKVIDAVTDEVIDQFGQSGRFWLAPLDPAGTTGPDHTPQAGPGLPADEGPAHLDDCVDDGGIATCADGCPRFAAIAATRKSSLAEIEQWIADQVSKLSESELLLVKAVLDEIRAGRPVEHFEPGTKVYVGSYGTIEFIVQGTAPWHENGVVSRKVEVRSTTGNLSGHVDPRELRRVPC